MHSYATANWGFGALFWAKDGQLGLEGAKRGLEGVTAGLPVRLSCARGNRSVGSSTPRGRRLTQEAGLRP